MDKPRALYWIGTLTPKVRNAEGLAESTDYKGEFFTPQQTDRLCQAFHSGRTQGPLTSVAGHFNPVAGGVIGALWRMHDNKIGVMGRLDRQTEEGDRTARAVLSGATQGLSAGIYNEANRVTKKQVNKGLVHVAICEDPQFGDSSDPDQGTYIKVATDDEETAIRIFCEEWAPTAAYLAPELKATVDVWKMTKTGDATLTAPLEVVDIRLGSGAIDANGDVVPRDVADAMDVDQVGDNKLPPQNPSQAAIAPRSQNRAYLTYHSKNGGTVEVPIISGGESEMEPPQQTQQETAPIAAPQSVMDLTANTAEIPSSTTLPPIPVLIPASDQMAGAAPQSGFAHLLGPLMDTIPKANAAVGELQQQQERPSLFPPMQPQQAAPAAEAPAAVATQTPPATAAAVPPPAEPLSPEAEEKKIAAFCEAMFPGDKSMANAARLMRAMKQSGGEYANVNPDELFKHGVANMERQAKEKEAAEAALVTERARVLEEVKTMAPHFTEAEKEVIQELYKTNNNDDNKNMRAISVFSNRLRETAFRQKGIVVGPADSGGVRDLAQILGGPSSGRSNTRQYSSQERVGRQQQFANEAADFNLFAPPAKAVTPAVAGKPSDLNVDTAYDYLGGKQVDRAMADAAFKFFTLDKYTGKRLDITAMDPAVYGSVQDKIMSMGGLRSTHQDGAQKYMPADWDGMGDNPREWSGLERFETVEHDGGRYMSILAE